MSAASPDSESSQSSSGYEDGLGRRVLAFDRETGDMLERLVLRPELTAFEAALRERLTIVAGLEDERFTRPREIERGADDRLTVVSENVAGRRLSDVLDAAAENGIVAGLDAGLGLLLELLPALARLHDAGLAHGSLAPGRIMITPAGQTVILDAIYAEPLERLRLTRRRLWSEFRLAFPSSAGGARFDKAADLGHAAMAAAALSVGRPLREDDYPDGIPALRQEIVEIASIRGSKAFAEGVDKFLASTLPLAGRRGTPWASADEAAIDLRKLVRKELGINTCRTALLEFFQQVETADGERMAAETAQQKERARAETERLAALADADVADLEAERVEALPIARDRADAERKDREQARERTEAQPKAQEKSRTRAEAERVEPERLARERDETARREQDRTEKARLHTGRLEQERARLDAKRLDAERLGQGRARLEAERLEGERAEKARLDAERLEEARAEKTRLDAKRLEAERLERERAEKARLDAERLEQERARLDAKRRDAERLERERAEKARLESERKERERKETERREKVARERAEKARREQERAEKARIEAARLEQEGADAERRERELLDAARTERERAGKARLDAERLEEERAEHARLEAEREEQEETLECAERARIEANRLQAEQRERGREREETLARDRTTETEQSQRDVLGEEEKEPTAPAPGGAATGWLIPPDRAAKFESALPDVLPPAPTARVYPIYVPPAEPSSWTSDMPAEPGMPELEPVAAAPPAATVSPARGGSVTPATGTGAIRLKDEATGHASWHRAESRHEPDEMSAEGAYEPFGTIKPAQPVPWKLIAAGVFLIGATVAVTRDYTPASVPILKTVRNTARVPAEAPATPPVAGGAGRLAITTQPPGARVTIDGKAAGDTPLTLDTMSPGRHEVVVTSASGASAKRTVRVEAGKTIAIDLPLFSGFAAISAPFVIDVSENGKSLGTSSEQILLSPGRHELRVSNTDLGYVATETVEVQPGEVTRVSLDPHGRANINAAPWAEVWIDGEKAGDTPLANVAIRLGTREIVFKNPQYGERKVTATITAGAPATISVDFIK